MLAAAERTRRRRRRHSDGRQGGRHEGRCGKGREGGSEREGWEPERKREHGRQRALGEQ